MTPNSRRRSWTAIRTVLATRTSTTGHADEAEDASEPEELGEVAGRRFRGRGCEGGCRWVRRRRRRGHRSRWRCPGTRRIVDLHVELRDRALAIHRAAPLEKLEVGRVPRLLDRLLRREDARDVRVDVPEAERVTGRQPTSLGERPADHRRLGVVAEASDVAVDDPHVAGAEEAVDRRPPGRRRGRGSPGSCSGRP